MVNICDVYKDIEKYNIKFKEFSKFYNTLKNYSDKNEVLYLKYNELFPWINDTIKHNVKYIDIVLPICIDTAYLFCNSYTGGDEYAETIFCFTFIEYLEMLEICYLLVIRKLKKLKNIESSYNNFSKYIIYNRKLINILEIKPSISVSLN